MASPEPAGTDPIRRSCATRCGAHDEEQPQRDGEEHGQRDQQDVERETRESPERRTMDDPDMGEDEPGGG
jgi:hypothetical protein